VKWKLQIEMKLLGKNGIIIEIEIFFRMEITLHVWRDLEIYVTGRSTSFKMQAPFNRSFTTYY